MKSDVGLIGFMDSLVSMTKARDTTDGTVVAMAQNLRRDYGDFLDGVWIVSAPAAFAVFQEYIAIAKHTACQCELLDITSALAILENALSSGLV